MENPFSGDISSSTESRPMQGIAPAGNFAPVTANARRMVANVQAARGAR